MSSTYFDNAATTKVREEVFNSMIPYLKNEFGNPSAMYTIGRRAKTQIENARKNVAGLINAKPNEIFFTAGGSESDNFALKGIAHKYKDKGNHIITSCIEHHAILNTCKTLEEEGFDITYIKVNKDGIIDLEELKNNITDKTILISVMFANNEIGSIQPIKEIYEIAKQNNIIFHTDAVQACGNINIDVNELGVDLLSISGHKLHAPKGVGALYIREGIEIKNLIDGGKQEKGKRAGTENVASIVGFGTACRIANDELETHTRYLKKLRDYYILEVSKRIPNVVLNGSNDQRLPGNANISFKGVEGQTLLLKLDQVGICVSSASACSSGSTEPSHVLTAIGLSSDDAKSALRVTFGDENNIEDVDFLINNLEKFVGELRKEVNNS